MGALTGNLATMSRRDAVLLRSFAIWTIYVWTTRMWNIAHDDEHGTGFKVVHGVLAVISVALAVTCLAVVRRNRSRGRSARSDVVIEESDGAVVPGPMS